MKHNFLRRLSALMLSLVMVLTLSAPVRADEGEQPGDGESGGTFSVSFVADKSELKAGETAVLTAAVSNPPAQTSVTYEWSCQPEGAVSFASVPGEPATKCQMTALAEGQAEISVTAIAKRVNGAEAGRAVSEARSITVFAADIPVSGVTLDQTELILVLGRSERLNAVVEPEHAADKTVTWSSSNDRVVSVDQDGTVTALTEGTAVITATAGGVSAQCTVTATVPVTGIAFSQNTIQFDNLEAASRQVSVSVTPSNAVFGSVVWESSDPQVATAVKDSATGILAVVTAIGPGEATIKATAGDRSAECKVIVSGITLNRTTLTMEQGKTDLLSVAGTFGKAEGKVEWLSSDMSVVSVTGGRITARSIGTATITASKGPYTASCVVTVVEDTSGLIDAGRVTAGNKLSFADLRAVLNDKSLENTEAPLSYITNLSVATAQGVVHNEYLSEGDTGAGVGMTERYYYAPTAGQLDMKGLAFVPRTDYNGVAEISYTAWSTNRQSFTGVIRVIVGAATDVIYTTNEGTALNFRSIDFNAACRGQTGRDLSYVTFTLPQTNRGTLYYNYNGQTQYAEKVTESSQYHVTGIPNLDNVTFLPAEGYSGAFSIVYRAVDTAGAAFTGRVSITVADHMSTHAGDLYVTAAKGGALLFQTSAFNDACLKLTGETLNYVRFTQPGSSQGVLYYNYRGSGSYDGEVTPGTNYYRIGTPALSNVCFISSPSAADQVAIRYTGCGTGGTSFSGTVYVRMGDLSKQNIQYTVCSGKFISLQTADFDEACAAVKGTTLDYVQFQPSLTNQGTLCYQYNASKGFYTSQVTSYTRYYRTAGTGTNGVSYRLLRDVSFLARADYTGTVRIPYTAVTRDGDSFTGTLIIQVTDPAAEDVNYTGTAAQPVKLSSANLRAACNAAMTKELSYIQITSLPSEEAGRLYSNYSTHGTGSLVSAGTRYYCAGSPSIDQLSFVPRSGFQGTAVIGYTGVSTDGQQVRGQIKITISIPGSSRYFSDMGGYSWAASAVDYLYQNGVTQGMTVDSYGPALSIRRCDFVVMLCRAFGFQSGGGASFADVPAGTYYSDAVAAAKRLGIVSGDGVNFRPTGALTRQDAMVIIRNTLSVLGWSVSNSSTDNLSAFSDSALISGYARPAVSTLVELGVIKGDTSGRMRPWDPVTRAEMAVMLHYIMTM